MSYTKRISSPKTWVTPRKGTKYLTSAYPGKIKNLSMPLNLVVRDLLKIANTRKEVKIMLNQKDILVNGKFIKTEKFPVGIFEILSIPKIKKNYRIIINEKKKFAFEEIKDSENKSQICKIINKKSLNKGKVQLNLFNGGNILGGDKKIKVNDSIVITKGKITKHLPLKEDSKVYIMGGSHLGHNGVVNKLNDKTVDIKINSKNFTLQLKNIYVTA